MFFYNKIDTMTLNNWLHVYEGSLTIELKFPQHMDSMPSTNIGLDISKQLLVEGQVTG